jgi:hypothetical protein
MHASSAEHAHCCLMESWSWAEGDLVVAVAGAMMDLGVVGREQVRLRAL